MKIQVADDNADNRQLLADILSGLNYQLVMSYDGPSTLVTARAELPDLLILDVNMPGKSGFEVCAELKTDTATAHIPILMLTALGDVDNRVTGLGAGADDYLEKPFNPRELLARVRRRLETKVETDELRATQVMIRQTFERFVAPQVVEQLLRDPSSVKLGGTLQEVTVLFADLENFTPISERTPPELLLSVLNRYHGLVVGIIQRYGGTIDKFIGDAVMALYNTPLQQDDHALRAVAAAIAIRESLHEFHQTLEPEFRMGINFGISTGMAVVGNVGAPELMDFTAVGDTVNVAARLQSLSSSSQILIEQNTYDQIRNYARVNKIGAQAVKGRRETVTVYEVVDLIS